MSKKKKEFTWADLKKIANKMPKDRLNDPVFIWTDRDDDASAFKVHEVFLLEEDYIFDQDEGCAPRSLMKEIIKEEKEAGTYDDRDYYIVHPKKRRIIYVK